MNPALAPMRSYELLCAQVGEYAGGDTSRAIVEMLETTEKMYIEELIDAGPDRVAALQQNIRQLRALCVVIKGSGGTPKI